MNTNRFAGFGSALVVVACLATAGAPDPGPQAWDGTIVQYGSMREAIGQKQSEGRVSLADVAARPHFYGVGALEGLAGEATFFDSNPTVTGVTETKELAALDSGDSRATLLVGASVPSWREQVIEAQTPAAQFDLVVRDAAAKIGLDTKKPFVFTADGDFIEVRVHVIHGACPMHARMQKIELPEKEKPFEAEYASIRGRLVGVYAEDAVGRLTHPATSTHVHLIFQDEAGRTLTGHVEKIGLSPGARLHLPR